MPGKKKQLDICNECKRASKPAIHAAKLGHTQCLTTAYRELGVFNERDNFGATPIHFAARFGQLECLKWLISRSGVSPNAVTRTGATAAHDAAATGHLNCLEYLLKNTKCDVRDTTSEGATVLHLACSFGRIEVVKWLMDYLGSSPSEKGANNVTPVHLCAAKNHLNCLKWLTKHPQYSPNEETEHGATAVYFAAQEGSLDCLKWLVLHASGDPYIAAEDGMSAIHAAAQAGQLSCLRWLVEEAAVPIRLRSADGATPAHFAAASGEVECLEWILNHGGSVLDRDELGGTLVHDAAEQGQVNALMHLMKRGVDMNSKDNDGLTPLDIAKENRSEECMRLLFKAQKPEILVSLTPKQSLSRASAQVEDEQQRAAQMRQKQREFEQILLSGVSNEEREAMWQTAQEKATAVQPGLKLLLEGQADASPSAFSLDGATRITPAGSLRRRQKPSNKDEFVPKDMSPFKPRPGLSTMLFDAPTDSKSKQDVAVVAKEPPKTPETTQSKVELRNKPKEKSGMSPSKKAEFRQSGSGESPIPKRAKFIKKFSAPKGASKDKKKFIKMSSTKLTAEGSKAKKSEQKSKKSTSSHPDSEQKVQLTKPRKESVTKETSNKKPRERKVSKTKVKPVPEPKQEKSAKKVVDSEPQKLQASVTSKGPESRINSNLQTPPTSYEVVAEALAEKLVKETVLINAIVDEKAGTNTTKEEAIIIEENEKRRSLLTPDKTVTVTFKAAPGSKQPSLITSEKMVADKDLSSPEGSDDESNHRQRDSFVTPGFVRLDHQNFQHFGENVQDFESQRADEDKKWQAGRVTSMRNSGGLLMSLGEKVKEGDGLIKKLNFEGKGTHLVENGVEDAKKDTALSRWDKRHSLNRIDQLPPREQQLISAEQTLEDNSENEEEDTVEATVSLISVESLHLKHLDSKAIYRKVQDFEHQWQERGYTQVLKMRDRLQEPYDDQATDGKGKRQRPSSGVQEGNVSTKLMMFGGGADYIESPWKQTQAQERPKTKLNLGSPAKTSPAKEESSSSSPTPSSENDAAAALREALKDVVDGPIDRSPSSVSPSHGKVKRRSSLSSRASLTTFETIKEAEEDKEEAEDANVDLDHSATELVADESTDKIVPLPKLHPNLSRRLSEERLRLDGLLPGEQSGNCSSRKETPLRESQSQSGSRSTKARSVLDSGEARQQLHVSFHHIEQKESPGSSALHEKMGKSRSRPVSAPPFHLKDSKTAAITADMVGLSGESEAKEILKAESKVAALLSAPQCTSSNFPPQLTRGSLQIWKQEAGYICSVGSALFNTTDVYIFHYVAWQGPLLHHVYQWVGSNASDSLVHSAYEHCQMLAKCLPGRPVMHREYQGYESFSFISALGSDAKLLKKYKAAIPYLNSFLTKAMLYTFDESLSSFETIEDSSISANHLRTLRVPVILDTPLCVFVWLPRKCWEDKKLKNAFSIAELFVAQCSYPKWTPVTVVIQDGEVWEFYSHFSSWPFVDLRLAERASALYLPTQKEPEFPTLTNSQAKIWLWENQEVKELAPDELDTLNSSHTYLVEHTEHKQSSLQETIYIWVGAEMAERKDVLLSAMDKAKAIGTSSKTPIMIVPESLEPPQLLNLLGIERIHPSSNKHPTHMLPLVFACEVSKGVVTFTQLQQPVTKKILKPEKCYLLSYKDMLFVQQGKRWKARMLPMDIATTFISQFHSWKSENDFIISLLTEGNEDEVFWKWFDMQDVPVRVEEAATIPKRPSKEDVRNLLVKAREIISDEIEAEEKDEVLIREPPTSRPLPLTRSQEATFESVEKLQAQLEDLAEGGQKNKTRSENEKVVVNSENTQKSPVRLSQAIQELSDITHGLNELLQSSAQARAEEQEKEAAAFKTEGAATDTPPSETSPQLVPADRNLIPSSEATLEENNPDTQVKSKRAEPSSESPTLSVTVEVAEGPSKGAYEVTVKEKSPVIVVIFKVARASGFVLKSTSAVFEVCEALKIQCPLEDHELIKDVIGRWPTKNPPKLVLRDFASKNILWSVNPPIPKESIRAFAKEGKIPEVSSDLLYSTKHGRSRKMKWKQSKHCLKGVGIYSIAESKKGSKLELSASLDHRLYTPIITSIKDSEIPNKYCFIMKPPLSWKEKDLKFYCAGDFMAMAQWVHGIRLTKFGIQLRGNYTAMRTRLKKMEVKTEETAPLQSTEN